MASPLCHFELLSDDPAKCKEFFGEVLGWSFDEDSMPGYTLINTGSDPGGGLMKRPGDVPQPMLGVYFRVDDIAATVTKIRAAGGKVLADVAEIPNVGRWAHVADPAGLRSVFFSRLRSSASARARSRLAVLRARWSGFRERYWGFGLLVC